MISVNPRVPGHVSAVLVRDNQLVKKGDILVELDKRDFEVRVADARAAVEGADARARAARGTVDYTRATGEAGIAEATSSLDAARAAIETARAQVGTATARLAQSRTQIAVADAGLDQARADLAAAEADQVRLDSDEKRYEEAILDNSVSRQELERVPRRDAVRASPPRRRRSRSRRAKRSVRRRKRAPRPRSRRSVVRGPGRRGAGARVARARPRRASRRLEAAPHSSTETVRGKPRPRPIATSRGRAHSCPGRARPLLHDDRRARIGPRHAQVRRARRLRRRRPVDPRARARGGLGRRELQGDPADAHAPGPEGRDPRRRLPGGALHGHVDSVQAARARASASCRPRTRRATT